MKKKCNHNIPETMKHAGPCNIQWEVKKRNGKPNWCCTTHAHEASAPDGTALQSCPGAWFDTQPQPRVIDIDASNGTFSVWGALGAAIEIGTCPRQPGGVHVHHRPSPAAVKDLDDSYDIVRVRGPNGVTVEVDSMAARAFSISELSGKTVTVLTCPKEQCRYEHIDEQKFATHPHVKHQCNRCGRNFREKNPTIGNPLAAAYERLGIARPPEPTTVDRPLHLVSKDYSGIAVWASNRAILTNRTTPEDHGVHVHAWDAAGNLVIDETYSDVFLDGERIDHDALRALTVQRELADGAPIVVLACEQCGVSMISPTSGWIEASTSHTCQACGATTKTRRRVMANPLATKVGGGDV